MITTLICKWHISDYRGRRDTNIPPHKINGIDTYKCKGLSAWIRHGQYLIRFDELIWYLGGNLNEDFLFNNPEKRHRLDLKGITNRLKELLGDNNLIEGANYAQGYLNDDVYKYNYFLARKYNLTREDVEKFTLEEVAQKLINTK